MLKCELYKLSNNGSHTGLEKVEAVNSNYLFFILFICSGSKLPAYKRFSYLLEAKQPKPVPCAARNLPLPYHFKILEEMFRCVDVVLNLKQKRYETCTFEKLKESVQEMCRK